MNKPTLMRAERFPIFMGGEADDVRRVLTILFRGITSIARPDLERTLSFDMEWVAPHEAEEVVDALLNKGWLKTEQGELHLNVALGDVQVPFGWFPRPTHLLKPVGTTSEPTSTPSEQQTPRQPQATPSPASTPSPEHLSNDPRAVLTRRLIRFIARQSGLSMDELERRAERKIRAFHHITPWLAYALVGREQGLEMESIADALAVV